MKFSEQRKEFIFWAKLLNERGFVTARSGNISYRVGSNELLITSHNSYLGSLANEDILLTDISGNLLEGQGEPTSEKELHLTLYRVFPDTQVVLHAHSPFSTAFFYYHKLLPVFSFEAEFYLGKIPVVDQITPTVTELTPVLQAFGKNNIIVLRRHGVVAKGSTFREAFSLIELLEEQARVGLMIYASRSGVFPDSSQPAQQREKKTYVLLSQEHIQKLTEIINSDSEAQALGRKYNLTMTFAIKNQDTGQSAGFTYDQGKITKTSSGEDAEFMIIGSADILRKVFNRELDPFVALTQGKVRSKGDFSKMSKWYPVMVRTFQLWEQAPVE